MFIHPQTPVSNGDASQDARSQWRCYNGRVISLSCTAKQGNKTVKHNGNLISFNSGAFSPKGYYKIGNLQLRLH